MATNRPLSDTNSYSVTSTKVHNVPVVRANIVYSKDFIRTAPVEFVTASGAMSVATQVTYLDTTNGPLAVTLADGTYTGQRKLVVHSAGTEPAVVTPTNLAGGTSVTTSTPGASYSLEWADGSWVVTSLTAGPSGIPALEPVTLPSEGPAGSLALDSDTGAVVLADPRTLRYAPSPQRPAYKLLIYYGFPSLLNSIPSLAGIAQAVSEYDVVVFGDGIQNPAHPDHANLQTIMDELRVLSPQTLVAGYIDLGVSTQNLTTAQIQQYTAWWADMGADLIFWDDAGFDFLTTRDRQNFAITTARANSMDSFMNAFDTDDLFVGSPATLMGPNDWFLLESLPYNDGGVYAGTSNWEPRATMVARINKALGHRSAFKSRIAATSLVDYTAYTNDQNQYIRNTAQAVCFAAGLDAYGDNAGPFFSASGATANTIFKGAWDEDMGRASAYTIPAAMITVAAGAEPASLRRYDYNTIVYYDEGFAPPTWAAVTPRSLTPLWPQGLAGGQPPAGERGRIATNTAGVYIYDTGAAWAAI